jgi:hypothetical protein
MRFLIIALYILLHSNVCADPAEQTDKWQFNKNVKISFIWVYNDNQETLVFMDNEQVCYISKADTNLLNTAFAIVGTAIKTEVVCFLQPDKMIDGKDTRRIHRIRYGIQTWP